MSSCASCPIEAMVWDQRDSFHEVFCRPEDVIYCHWGKVADKHRVSRRSSTETSKAEFALKKKLNKKKKTLSHKKSKSHG